MKIVNWIDRNFRKIFWSSCIALLVYFAAFLFLLFPHLGEYNSFAVYGVIICLFAVPAFSITILALYGLIQTFQKKRKIIHAAALIVVAALVDVALGAFFFFVTFSMFGFS